MNKIVELNEKLYIMLSMVNREDAGSCAYDRIFKLYPYSSELPDDIEIDLLDPRIQTYHLSGTNNTVFLREDKIPYKQYGYSNIREKEIVKLERQYPERPIAPTK